LPQPVNTAPAVTRAHNTNNPNRFIVSSWKDHTGFFEKSIGRQENRQGNVIYSSSKKIRRIVTTTNLWFAHTENTEERKKKERETAVFPLFLCDLCGLCGEFSSHYYDGTIFMGQKNK
jgi:hypothetical protein